MDDWDLLQTYAKNRSDAAFAELVQRHLDWIYSAALRQVRDPHLARDVAQTVFVLLARKAGKLRRGTIVAGWLFRTTRYVAARAVRTEQRRRVREESASVMMSTTNSPDDNEILWKQLAPHLDQAVAALSQTDRSAILLRFYERKPLREVGQQLGLTEDAAKKRVTRAVEKLRTFLTSRGVVLGGAGLIAILAEQTVHAAPTSFGISVVKIATTSLSPSAVLPELARDALHAWQLAKLKLASVIVAVSVAGVILAVKETAPRREYNRSTPHPTSDSPNASATQSDEPGSRLASHTMSTNTVAAKRVIDLRVIGTSSKQPLADADIHIYEVFGMADAERHEITGRTDEDGRYQIELPTTDPPHLSATAHKDGFVPMRVDWSTQGGTFHLPREFTLTLEPATSIGGVIQNEQGQPITGASVFLLLRGSNMSGATEEVFVDIFDDKVVTDAQGRWRFDRAPSDLSSLAIRLADPDYISSSYFSDTFSDTPLPPVEKLRDMRSVMVMKKGVSLSGVVVDSQGAPIANASVAQGSDRIGTTFPDTKTDLEGRFAIGNVKPGQIVLTVQADGYAPELKMIDVNSQTQPLEIRLTNGFVIRGRVVGRDGKPISGVGVAADTWRNHRSLKWRTESDDEGRFVWSNAPPDEVQFGIFKDGFARHMRDGMSPSEVEHTITLLPLLRVHGRVVDADTGQPIAKFSAIPGRVFQDARTATWDRAGTIHCTDGQYAIEPDSIPMSIHIDRTIRNGVETITTNVIQGVRLVRIEADGYLPAVSREFQSNEVSSVADFKLKPGSGPMGVVRLPNGSPAVGAHVVPVLPGRNLVLVDGRLQQRDLQQADVVTTGPDGSFSLPAEIAPFTLAVIHNDGYAEVDSATASFPIDIPLHPWGRVDGTFLVSTNPVSKQEIRVSFEYDLPDPKKHSVAHVYMPVQSDENGRFAFERVRAGQVVLFPSGMHVEVKSGETTTVTLGGAGRPIVGRVVRPTGTTQEMDLSFGEVTLTTQRPPVLNRIDHAGKNGSDPQARQALYREWMATDEGRAYRNAQRSFSAKLNHDGSFRVEDVTAGSYTLLAVVKEPHDRTAPDRFITAKDIAWTFRDVVVPDIPDGHTDEPLDLGEIAIQPYHR